MNNSKQLEDLSLWQRTNDARLNELADYIVDGMDMDDLMNYAKEQLMSYWSTAQEHFETEYKEFETEHKMESN